jgi:hypothetical protein
MVAIVISVLALFLSYYFYRPYLKTAESRKMVLKAHLILIPIAFAFYLLASYLIGQGQPLSFNEGVELLKNNKEVISKIGTYQSYTFSKNELPKEIDNPATFKVAMNGTTATIYLTCEMQKAASGKWFLKKIKEDSLMVKH